MDKFEDQVNKMKHLMAFKGINESNTVNYKKIDHQEVGADGKMYAIIRENTKFVIKESSMDKPLLAEDFEYIGGFNNRKNNSFDSYSLALKQFDLKLRAINEKYARKGAIVESFNPEFYQDSAVKSTDEMKKEINRQRQIMENASRIGVSEDKIDMFKYKDYNHEVPEAPKKSNGIASDNGDPYTNAINLDKTTDNVKNYKVQGDPFEEEVIEDNQEDKLETVGKSTDNKKPKSEMKPVVYNQDKINEALEDFPEDEDGDMDDDTQISIEDDMDDEEKPEDETEGNDLDSVINDLHKVLYALEALNTNDEDEDINDEDTEDTDTEEFEIPIHEDEDFDDDDYQPTYADELAKYGVKDIDNDEKFDKPYEFNTDHIKNNMSFPIPSKVKYISDDKPNLKNRVFVYGGPGKKGNDTSYIFNDENDDEEYLVPTKNLQLIKESSNKHYFSDKEREGLAKKGEAMKTGSFPIRNTQDLKDAIKSIGRAKDPEAAKRFIKKRAKELGKESLLPDNWKRANEDKINDYGRHPEYGKEAMDISGDDKDNGYGKKIGDGDPFNINLIVDGVMKELKRMNIVKESVPEKKK